MHEYKARPDLKESQIEVLAEHVNVSGKFQLVKLFENNTFSFGVFLTQRKKHEISDYGYTEFCDYNTALNSYVQTIIPNHYYFKEQTDNVNSGIVCELFPELPRFMTKKVFRMPRADDISVMDT